VLVCSWDDWLIVDGWRWLVGGSMMLMLVLLAGLVGLLALLPAVGVGDSAGSTDGACWSR
jgi:hypothetical protein